MNKVTALIAVITLAIGLGLGYLLFDDPDKMSTVSPVGEWQPLFYRNPMNPDVTSAASTKLVSMLMRMTFC